MNDPGRPPGPPPLAVQAGFWDEWNLSHRTTRELDSFQTAQRDAAVAAAGRLAMSMNRAPLRILDFGCGTGWLGASLTSFGEVTGVDLSPASIKFGGRFFPDVRLFVGHFLEISLDGPFDMIVSADVLSHVADQQAYVQRVAELLRPGGVFLLMTQNGFVWSRSTYLAPRGEGQIRNWPSLGRIRSLLEVSGLRIARIGSIEPGGNRGFLRVVNNRRTTRFFEVVGLGPTWRNVLERLRVGRELTIEAHRV